MVNVVTITLHLLTCNLYVLPFQIDAQAESSALYALADEQEASYITLYDIGVDLTIAIRLHRVCNN